MKKFYYLNVLILAVLTSTANGQNMIIGGDMEIEEDWLVSLLNTDADNSTNYSFGYTDDAPFYGKDGCLYIEGDNTGLAGGQLTNIMFYQQVILERGTVYNFDGAYKDIRTNNYWIEVYVGGNAPVEGSDYGADQGAVLVSGFKSMNWEATCTSDEFDGTFQADACIDGITNEVFFEGIGDTTVYFGFRMGIWDDGGNGFFFVSYVDEISLTAEGASGVGNTLSNDLSVYPNPFNNSLTVSLSNSIQEIDVLNMVGQSIYRQTNVDATDHTVDLQNLAAGVYCIIVKDQSGNTFVSKTIKQ